MAKRSKALELLINWAGTTRRNKHSPELPSRIRDVLLRESGLGSDDPDAEVLAWRQMLAIIPLDSASFKGLYGPERGSRATETQAVSRRHFLDDLSWCCERQMELMSDASLPSLGYLAVLFLTLLTMEDADDRRFDDLADWGVVQAGPAKPERVTAAQQYADLCDRLFTFDEVGEALRALYEPEWSKDREAIVDVKYDARAFFESGDKLPADDTLVDLLAARRAHEVWSELDFDGMAFHRCGTTSFIVRTPWKSLNNTDERTDAAVKFVLMPYAELAAIERASRRYLITYGRLTRRTESAVKIWASARNLIVMQLVEGETLAQRVLAMQATRQGPRATPQASTLRRQVDRVRKYLAVENTEEGRTQQRFADREMLLRFGGPLFDALGDLRRNGLVHHDLNPSNVIVERKGDGESLIFIDFGRNYLYDQAGLSREGADAIYIAPEIRSGETPVAEDNDYRPDVYSLGQLLIALSGVGRDAEGVVPDPFYRRTPLLARFLEDLIEREPDLRLLVNQPHDGTDLYSYLKEVFTDNVKATHQADQLDGVFGPPSTRRRLIVTYGPVSGAVRRLRRLREATHNKSDDPWWATSDWLYRWSVCSAVMWYGCLTLLTYLLVADFGWVPAGFLTALARDGYQVPPDDAVANLTARLTGITFCLAAVKYYQNVYSNLTTRALPGMTGRLRRLRFWTEFWVRLNALFVALVVVPVNLLQPTWWTVGSAVGLFDSLMVNFTGSLFALIAVQEARTPSATRSDHRPRLSTVPQNIPGLSMYRMWAPSMAAYVGIVLFFAVLINTKVLRDDLAYASVVSALNIVLFYGIKCGINAEPVRIGLTRAYLAAERLSRARDAGLVVDAKHGTFPATSESRTMIS